MERRVRDPHPTRHLVEKMNSRSVTWGEILEVINQPEATYGPDNRGRVNYQKGRLCVVVDKYDAVVTVLLRQEEQWDDAQARAREAMHE